jgi:hypothetical protein
VSATISAISAAHIVFTSGVNIVMYPWDVFEEFWFSRDDATQFASSAHAWARLAGELMLSDMNRFDLERATMGDAGTVCFLIDETAGMEYALCCRSQTRSGDGIEKCCYRVTQWTHAWHDCGRFARACLRTRRAKAS